jgi:hypothetical protein
VSLVVSGGGGGGGVEGSRNEANVLVAAEADDDTIGGFDAEDAGLGNDSNGVGGGDFGAGVNGVVKVKAVDGETKPLKPPNLGGVGG